MVSLPGFCTQIKKAINDYTIVINHDPANGGAFFARGYCFLLLKQEYPAFLDWKKAKELGIAKEIAENWETGILPFQSNQCYSHP